MSTPYDFTELPDGLWEKFEPLLEPFKRKRSGGSPPISSRNIMNGIIFRLKTGCQWIDEGDFSAVHFFGHRRWGWKKWQARKHAYRALGLHRVFDRSIYAEEFFTTPLTDIVWHDGTLHWKHSPGMGVAGRATDFQT